MVYSVLLLELLFHYLNIIIVIIKAKEKIVVNLFILYFIMDKQTLVTDMDATQAKQKYLHYFMALCIL